MQAEYQRRYYSPKLSYMAAVSVKHLAMVISKSQPKTIDLMVKLLPSIVDPLKICLQCQDKGKCQNCIFSKENKPEEIKPEELAALEKVV